VRNRVSPTKAAAHGKVGDREHTGPGATGVAIHPPRYGIPFVDAAPRGPAVLQAKWEITDALGLLRKTDPGKAAAKRIVAGITIHRHADSTSFPTYVLGDGKIVDGKPLNIGGFGKKESIHISNAMEAADAAAMMVHESTHSDQNKEGGIAHEWAKKKESATRDEVEFQMEFEAHINQYQHELAVGKLSPKAVECLNADKTAIDEAKVTAQIKRLYFTKEPEGVLDQAARQLQEEVKAKNKAARSAALKAFLAQKADVFAPLVIRGILVELYAAEKNQAVAPAVEAAVK
jgi:hypothetical protein